MESQTTGLSDQQETLNDAGMATDLKSLIGPGSGVVPGIRPIALVGHKYLCPVHGHEGSVIVTGSPTCSVMNRPVARIGDKTSCGAIIITGSKNAHVDGNRPIARLGDKGIHPESGIEGQIVEGMDKWTLE